MSGIRSGLTNGRAESTVARIDPGTPAAAGNTPAKTEATFVVLRCASGVHVFRLEAMHGDPAAFVDDFCRVLEPPDVPREDLLRFGSRDGGCH